MPMTDPDLLTAAIITTLKSIQPLITSPLLANGASSIIPYETNMQEGHVYLEDFVLQQPPGTLVVFWKQTRTGFFNKLETIKHDFGISLKPKGRAAAMFALIREGLCDSSGMKFKLTQVAVPDDLGNPTYPVRPPEDMSCQNRSIYIGPNFGIREFTDISLTLTERGIDN